MFWFRRVAALTVLAVLVGLVVVVAKTVVPGISSALSGSDRPVTVVSSDTPAPTKTGPIGDCVPGEVVASVVPRTTTVPWGKDVVLDVTLRNQGAGPCVADGGSDATTVVVRTADQQEAFEAAQEAAGESAPTGSETTGSRTPGTSATRRPSGTTTTTAATKTVTAPATTSATTSDAYVWSSGDCSPAQRLLLLDVGDEDAQSVVWHRERSTSGCGKGLGSVGAGSYAVTVTVLGATSEPVTVTLAPRPEPTSPATSGAATSGSTDGSAPTTGTATQTPDGTASKTPDGTATKTPDGTATKTAGTATKTPGGSATKTTKTTKTP